MDKAEAQRIARDRLGELRKLSYEELRKRFLDQPDTIEVRGSSGTTYQVETEALWDADEGGDLRVSVAVDDGGWRAFVPLTDDFIVSPDGSFVDE